MEIKEVFFLVQSWGRRREAGCLGRADGNGRLRGPRSFAVSWPLYLGKAAHKLRVGHARSSPHLRHARHTHPSPTFTLLLLVYTQFVFCFSFLFFSKNIFSLIPHFYSPISIYNIPCWKKDKIILFQAATPLLTGTCRINVAESIQHPRRHCCTCLSVYVGQYTREHSTSNDDKKK